MNMCVADLEKLSSPYQCSEPEASMSYPRKCDDCNKKFPRSAYQHHISKGCESKKKTVYEMPITTPLYSLPCPWNGCSQRTPNQYELVHHYNTNHQRIHFQRYSVSCLADVNSILKQMFEASGCTMVLAWSTNAEWMYMCYCQASKMIPSCTAFLHAQKTPTGILISFCSHHTHAIAQPAVQIPPDALRIIDDCISQQVPIGGIHLKLKQYALSIPEQFRDQRFHYIIALTPEVIYKIVMSRVRSRPPAQPQANSAFQIAPNFQNGNHDASCLPEPLWTTSNCQMKKLAALQKTSSSVKSENPTTVVKGKKKPLRTTKIDSFFTSTKKEEKRLSTTVRNDFEELKVTKDHVVTSCRTVVEVPPSVQVPASFEMPQAKPICHELPDTIQEVQDYLDQLQANLFEKTAFISRGPRKNGRLTGLKSILGGNQLAAFTFSKSYDLL